MAEAGEAGAEETAGLFDDPPDFYAPTVPARTTTYTRSSGEVLTLQLPPQHSLWAHHLWNGGRVLARMIDTPGGIRVDPPQVRLHPPPTPLSRPPPHATAVCPPHAPLSLCLDGLAVAELGAGAGLPSLLAATTTAARAVVATDYPDAPLLEALTANAAAAAAAAPAAPLTVAGLRWGDAPAAAALVAAHGPFDVVLMADLVSNHGAHAKLLATLEVLVGGATGGGVGVVAYGHHRVACVDADEAFFVAAADAGWHVGGGGVVQCAPMFVDDPGDAEVRGAVHVSLLYR